ncbi:YdiK family protein [Bacillus fonticola]|uniref:YdiK family protein n=1 Tax=Bacillus fonticola TaxID=2728853 RepID=UPI001472CE9D|nr:YdiK family protein [Bacillus fonticola]
MRRSPLFTGVFYLILGLLFTYFATRNVQQEGWGFFTYLLVLLATFDTGVGIKLIFFHFAIKNRS